MNRLTASDIMRADLKVITWDDTLKSAWELLTRSRISGAPVVDDHGAIVGVISQTDLLRAVYLDSLESFPASAYYVGAPFWEPEKIDGIEARLESLYVRDYMSRSVVSALPEAEISSLAVLMRSQEVHRIIIVENDKPVGIVTALDLIKVLEAH